MTTPIFAIGDKVLFVAPFNDSIEYTVYGIQYMDENNEFTDQVTDNFQYRLAMGLTVAVETYLEAAPVL
jgi:hypothetical protein